MNYSEVLGQTWKITWRYKGLWILGILAGCANGGGGGGGGSNISDSANGELPQFLQNVPEEIIVAVVVGLLCLALLLALVFLILGVIGEAGLFAGFDQVDSGADMTFAEAFRLGLTYFWRLLGVQILIAIAIIILVFLGIGVALLFTVFTFGLGLLCLLPLLLLLIPVAIAFGIYTTLVKVAIVVDKLDVFSSFQKAWDVVRENPGPVIVIGLILVVGGGLAGFILALPLVVVAAPAIVGIALQSEGAVVTGLGLAALCFVLYLPVLIVLNGVLATYINGAWTLTYRRLTGKESVEAPGLIQA